jgi:hypothetical protein
MKLLIKIFLIQFLLAPTTGKTQGWIEGRITDPDGEPLAFVSILLKTDSEKVLFSDIDGWFKTSLSSICTSITFRYVGFEEKTVLEPEMNRPLSILLSPSKLILETVDIIAGKNPADRLMKMAVKNRHQNNPERNNAYSCKTYSKMTIDLLPNAIAISGGKKNKESQKNIEKMEQISGLTVHRVSEEYDEGEIIHQECVPVMYNDTPETLEERIKHVERAVYPQVIHEQAKKILT